MTLHILALETSSSLCGVALLSIHNGVPVIRSLAHDATAEHAERLLPMVDELLAGAGISAADLSVVAFGQGPGGFTGLRVACGVAQGIAFALDIPVIPVVSLLAVAARDQLNTISFQPGFFVQAGLSAATSQPDGQLRVVVQDARMGELYVAAYIYDIAQPAKPWRELQTPILLDVADIAKWLQYQLPVWQQSHQDVSHKFTIRLLGDALQVYPELAATVRQVFPDTQAGPPLRPDAETIAWLAWQAWQRHDSIAPDLAAPLYVRDKVAYTTLEREQGLGGNPKAPGLAASVQAMTPAHLDEVAAIEQAVQSFPWTRRNFEDGLTAGYGAWVSCQAGKVTGFCMVMFAPDVAHVLVLAVAPACQKQGLGALLLRECEREARARGLPALILEVRPSNVGALAFYQHVGFTQFASRKDYYPSGHGKREDALVMEKRLVLAKEGNG